jgi:hypothetical protein
LLADAAEKSSIAAEWLGARNYPLQRHQRCLDNDGLRREALGIGCASRQRIVGRTGLGRGGKQQGDAGRTKQFTLQRYFPRIAILWRLTTLTYSAEKTL